MSAPTMSANALEVLEALERLAAVCSVCHTRDDDVVYELRTGDKSWEYVCCSCAEGSHYYGCEVCDNYIHEVDLAPYDERIRLDWVCEWCYSEWENDKAGTSAA